MRIQKNSRGKFQVGQEHITMKHLPTGNKEIQALTICSLQGFSR